MAIQHIQVISLPVSDVDRAKAFYVDVLGFALRTDISFGDGEHRQRWVEVAPPDGPTRLTLVTWFPQMPPGSLQGLVLLTDDIQADYSALQARGLRFDGEISAAPWGTFATFSDPDGNGWVLQENA